MRYIQKGGLSSTHGEDSTDVKVGWAENILIPSCHVCYRNSPHFPPNKKQKRDKAHLRRGKPHGLGDKSYREAFSRFSAAAEPLQPFCSNWPEQELETVESVVTGKGGGAPPCHVTFNNKTNWSHFTSLRPGVSMTTAAPPSLPSLCCLYASARSRAWTRLPSPPPPLLPPLFLTVYGVDSTKKVRTYKSQ